MSLLLVLAGLPALLVALWSTLLPVEAAGRKAPPAGSGKREEEPSPVVPAEIQDLLARALHDLWSGEKQEREDYIFGPERPKMARDLLAALPRQPETFRAVDGPAPYTSGLYIVQAIQQKGRKVLLGVQMSRHHSAGHAWEVESLLVLAPAR